MKKLLSITAAAMLSVALLTPAAAYADGGDNAGAAALGFFVGALVGQASQGYQPPPRVVYRPRVRYVAPREWHREHHWDHRPHYRRFDHHRYNRGWGHDHRFANRGWGHDHQNRWRRHDN